MEVKLHRPGGTVPLGPLPGLLGQGFFLLPPFPSPAASCFAGTSKPHVWSPEPWRVTRMWGQHLFRRKAQVWGGRGVM